MIHILTSLIINSLIFSCVRIWILIIVGVHFIPINPYIRIIIMAAYLVWEGRSFFTALRSSDLKNMVKITLSMAWIIINIYPIALYLSYTAICGYHLINPYFFEVNPPKKTSLFF